MRKVVGGPPEPVLGRAKPDPWADHDVGTDCPLGRFMRLNLGIRIFETAARYSAQCFSPSLNLRTLVTPGPGRRRRLGRSREHAPAALGRRHHASSVASDGGPNWLSTAERMIAGSPMPIERSV